MKLKKISISIFLFLLSMLIFAETKVKFSELAKSLEKPKKETVFICDIPISEMKIGDDGFVRFNSVMMKKVKIQNGIETEFLSDRISRSHRNSYTFKFELIDSKNKIYKLVDIVEFITVAEFNTILQREKEIAEAKAAEERRIAEAKAAEERKITEEKIENFKNGKGYFSNQEIIERTSTISKRADIIAKAKALSKKYVDEKISDNQLKLIKFRNEWDALLKEATISIAKISPAFVLVYNNDVFTHEMKESDYTNMTTTFEISPIAVYDVTECDNTEFANVIKTELNKINERENWGKKINGFPQSYRYDVEIEDNWLIKPEETLQFEATLLDGSNKVMATNEFNVIIDGYERKISSHKLEFKDVSIANANIDSFDINVIETSKKMPISLLTDYAKRFKNYIDDFNKNGMVKIPRKNYMMAKTEVTQGLYIAVMEINPSYFDGNSLLPVEKVSWYDCIYFCNKLSEKLGYTPVYSVDGNTDVSKWNYKPHDSDSIRGSITQNTDADGFRLPTEEEWEYAAKGGANYTYSGSDNLDEVGWYYGNSGNKTHPVGQKKANGYGLYDMSGNVQELCWDSDNDYSRSCCGGGSWSTYYYYFSLRCSGYGASYRDYDLGFRLCRSIK